MRGEFLLSIGDTEACGPRGCEGRKRDIGDGEQNAWVQETHPVNAAVRHSYTVSQGPPAPAHLEARMDGGNA